MWFVLALIALAGACVLLYFDRSRRDQTGRVRQIWAKAQGYTYESVEERLPAQFHRAAMAKQEYLSALDVVRGERRGESFILFDLEETATIVAVHRKVGSDVDIDLRLKSTPPPKDADLELLGAIGPRVVFATDLEIARRVCDQRMVAFTESVPPHVNMLWSEGEWTLGSMPINSTGREWDSAIEAVARLSGLLHVLPPVIEPRELDRQPHDPGRPRLREGRPAAGRPAEGRPAEGRPAEGRASAPHPPAGGRPPQGRPRP
ncbi:MULTISPECIES: hypothetical protein [Rhodococcus]|uniref:Secreted protein n=1 Tax=Rhodococcus oxybenzonivorans TaxID=1990687 RepID=A0AAE4UZM8_9NOCA|nr:MULTISPECIES: hypothetical protein [Rhodococcus]MDV7243795.1 hypothetical protein [Rhodococcus oxybenzonivorans]MDV7265384.1 hypothetical protein [Rhodococcus oxybenzonivorans]MDV7274963.1 hypothetical protein [Rhodococcus oxybenzonivorans]MDV7335202.1 hypothetical protein [Rhodococcus oxybenzonivorans]MDV7345912.1 hypothetical protein [Rhodococcus oxybenzonivorans]